MNYLKQVVVSGFSSGQPYINQNVSATLAYSMSKFTVGNFRANVRILGSYLQPAYGYAKTLLEFAEKIKASAVISLAMSPHVRKITIETVGINRVTEDARFRPIPQVTIDDTRPVEELLPADLQPWRLGTEKQQEAFIEQCAFSGVPLAISEIARSEFGSHLVYGSELLMSSSVKPRIPYLHLSLPFGEDVRIRGDAGHINPSAILPSRVMAKSVELLLQRL
jgi:hypothetical protein